MITSHFTGNLGNHLFEYVLTRVIADKNGYDFGFNPTPSHDSYGGLQQMDFMDIDYGIIHNAPYGTLPEGIKNVYNEKREHYDDGGGHDYYYYQPEIMDIPDNTLLNINCGQDARYYKGYKSKIRKWLHIKNENVQLYKKTLNSLNLNLDDDLCIINVRGSEYIGVYTLLLRNEYWHNCINAMKSINNKMKFIIVSEDPDYAVTIAPPEMNIPAYHFGIGMDYWLVNNAKNLIISNSSFAVFPTWLNQQNPHVIAPEYWARHNVSNGYWTSSAIWTWGWNFMGRNGVLHSHVGYES